MSKQVNYNDDTEGYVGKRKDTSELKKETSELVKNLREAHEMPVAVEVVEGYNTIRLVNLISAKVKLPGSVTGELYIWERSGAVVEVDERDAPDLLAKTLGKPCCGSTNVNRVFEIDKE